ncbi:MAG: YaiI/YqxD family protein [Acidobacteria bacterium]|nr:YaiI/YqxD family protein [Acidobacteriota bacterium]
MLKIFIDADGCPVKDEVYRVARRYGLEVALVANSRMHAPSDATIEMIVVDGKFDAADDWIVEHIGENDVVITADIPLASRCLKKMAMVLRPTGRDFTEENIGDALATRELMSYLRDLGTLTGGPAPFENKDRSRFLHRLDEIVQRTRRKNQRRPSGD